MPLRISSLGHTVSHPESSLHTQNLFHLSWPILIQNIAFSILISIDFWFLAQISDATAAVVGQLQPVMWLGTFIVPVFASTGVAVASQFLGAKQHSKVVPAYMTNLLFSFCMGLSIAILLFFLRNHIGLWMNMSNELNEISSRYISLMTWFFIFMSIVLAYNAICSSRGRTQWLMYTSLILISINLVLDALFFYTFSWGMEGIVWASICANIVALFIMLWLVHNKLSVRFYINGAYKDMLGVLRPMLKIGIPNALEPFSYSIQQIFLSAMIINMGLVSMAANSYGLRLVNFAIMICWSFANGGQILLAHYMGAQQFKQVNRLFWVMISSTILISLINALIVWYFADFFIGLFSSDPAVLATGKVLLLIAVFMEPARAVNIVGGVALRAVGDAKFPLIVSMIFIWGILPIIYLLDLHWGLTIFAMWLCFAVDEILRSLINLGRWMTGQWKTKGLVTPEPNAY